MASYNCCTSQDPPSPDGIPPRPIKLSSGRAPLKQLIAVPSGSTTSRFSKTEDAADIVAIFEPEGSDSDEEKEDLMRKKSSRTFAVVKSKLRKHLSGESALLRHRPRSTVGSSDEEIARRKQLKVLRDRRIQEELSHEASYDDDATSLSTVKTRHSPSRASHTGPATTPTNIWKCKSVAQILDPLKSDPLESDLRRTHSSATLERPMSLIPMDPNRIPLAILIAPPAPPAPFPALELHTPSHAVEPATRRTSWRLSFASERRGSNLRALSQEYGVSPPEPKAPEEIATGPLRWFRGQPIQMSSPMCIEVSTRPNQNDQAEGPPVCASSRSEDFGGVDGGSETSPPPIALHQMQISRRLTSGGLHSHSSSPQLSSWGSQAHYRKPSSDNSASKIKIMNRPRFYRHNSSIDQVEFTGHRSGSDFSRDGVSSFYPSTDNIAQVSPGGSRSNLSPFLYLEKGTIRSKAPTLERLLRTSSMGNLVDGKPTLCSAPSIRPTKYGRRSATSNSSPISETSSFRDRETELNGIKTRFPFALERLSPSTPIKSKFKEELSETQTPRQATLSSRLQTLPIPRIAKLASKSYDGATPLDLQIPATRQGWGYAFTSRSRSTIGTVSPGAKSPRSPSVDPLHEEEDEVAGMWAQALKRSHREQNRHIRRSNATREKNRGYGNFLSIHSGSLKLKDMVMASGDSRKGKEVDKLSIESKDFERERALGRKVHDAEIEKQNTEDWIDELEARERQAKAKTEAVGQDESPRATMPPESWARYPSHTRSDRTTSAGHQDHVEQKDFAIKTVKDGVVEWVAGERKHHHHHHQKDKHHSLPARVTNQIRATLYKLRTTKSSMMSDSIHGRKSSVSIGGKLEYPELELLPGESAGYGLLEEVENEMEAEMRREERTRRMVIFADGGSDVDFASDREGSKLDSYEASVISIADPKFYADCVSVPLYDPSDDGADSLSGKCLATVMRAHQHRDRGLLKNGLRVGAKYGTWSGRERTSSRFLDPVAMRSSTANFRMELEKMEAAEREGVLQAAAEAWA